MTKPGHLQWPEPLATSYWVQDAEGKEELHLWNEDKDQSYERLRSGAEQLEMDSTNTSEISCSSKHASGARCRRKRRAPPMERRQGTILRNRRTAHVGAACRIKTPFRAVQGHPAGQTRMDMSNGAHNRYWYGKTSETTTTQTTICIQGPGAEIAEGDGEVQDRHKVEQ